jgi:hypothetical protein
MNSLALKLAALFLLVSGWVIVIAAIALLASAARWSFTLSGMAIEAAGLVVMARAHLIGGHTP